MNLKRTLATVTLALCTQLFVAMGASAQNPAPRPFLPEPPSSEMLDAAYSTCLGVCHVECTVEHEEDMNQCASQCHEICNVLRLSE